jgi:hypothetical protein
LIFHFVLELAHFVFEVINAEFIQHDNVVVPMISKQTLKADAAQVIFTEGFDIFTWVDFALGLLNLTNLQVMFL